MPHLQAQFGTDSRIQLNDSFKTVDDIRDFIARLSLEDWHPFTHLGLDGIPWPLDEGPGGSLRLDVERGSLPP